MSQKLLLSCLLAINVVSHSVSQAQNLIYPELNVSPKASERVAMEAKQEASSKWTTHWPIQLSSAMTLASVFYAQSDKPEDYDTNPSKKEDFDNAAKTGTLVGATWLIGTYLLSENYRPYQKAVQEIKSLPTSNTQEQLVRERLAEEAMASSAKLGNRLMWMSVITNLGASAYIASSSGEDAKTFAGISTLVALTPLMFQYNWQDVYNYHQDYKKKIYAPIAMATLMPVDNKHLVPAMTLAWSF